MVTLVVPSIPFTSSTLAIAVNLVNVVRTQMKENTRTKLLGSKWRRKTLAAIHPGRDAGQLSAGTEHAMQVRKQQLRGIDIDLTLKGGEHICCGDTNVH